MGLIGWLRRHLASEPSSSSLHCEAAVAGFRSAHPGTPIKAVEVRATLEDAVIVAVYHGMGRPTPRTYLRVGRVDLVVSVEPRSRWWPRGVK